MSVVKRQCARPGCDSYVEIFRGKPGRPKEYCSERCRRLVEFAKRESPQVAEQGPTHDLRLSSRARLRKYVMSLYGQEAWARLVLGGIEEDTLASFLEAHLAASSPHRQAWEGLTEDGLAELHESGGSVWSLHEWKRSLEDHDGKLLKWTSPDPKYAGVVTEISPDNECGEIRIDEGAYQGSEDAAMIDHLDKVLDDREAFADKLTQWYLSMTDDELERVYRDAAHMADVHQAGRYGYLWTAIERTSRTHLVIREALPAFAALGDDELYGALRALQVMMGEIITSLKAGEPAEDGEAVYLAMQAAHIVAQERIERIKEAPPVP